MIIWFTNSFEKKNITYLRVFMGHIATNSALHRVIIKILKKGMKYQIKKDTSKDGTRTKIRTEK